MSVGGATMGVPAGAGTEEGARMAVMATDLDTDPAVEAVRVWCTDGDVAARVVGGFCECCGARDHDWL